MLPVSVGDPTTTTGRTMKKITVKKASPRKLTIAKETLRSLVSGGEIKATVGTNETRQVSICDTLCTNFVDGCPQRA
jgi:hypothetical protein